MKKPIKDSRVFTRKEIEGLRRGFREEYIDPHNIVDLTVEEIKDNMSKYYNNPKGYVAPYSSLVTSSMMGKSRFMKEIACKIPSIYLCLRESKSTGYPRPTSSLLKLINEGVNVWVGDSEILNDTNFIIPTFKYCSFLLHSLELLAGMVDDIVTNHRDVFDITDSYLWLWKIFAEPETPQEKERHRSFWDLVVKRTRDHMKSMANESAEDVVEAAHSYLQEDFGRNVGNAYAKLKTSFRISNDQDFTLLVICDEARILCDISAVDGHSIPTELEHDPVSAEQSSPPFSNFRALSRAFCYLQLVGSQPYSDNGEESNRPKKKRRLQKQSTEPLTYTYVPRIFALFTDTCSRLTNFQPTAWADRSMRVIGLPALGMKQFDPIFTFTSIDAHAMRSNANCTADINEVAVPTRLLKFGRAGWYSVGKHVKMNPVTFAMQKLAGGVVNWEMFFATPPEKSMSRKTRTALLAILAPRLSITAGPWLLEAAEMISSHLAVLMRTDEDRHFLRIAYPSEPIVAEASAQMTKKMGWGQVLKALFTSVQTGVVDAGFRGELLSKIMCLIAIDQSQQPRENNKWDFTRPVKVSLFLNNFIQPPGEPGTYSSVTAAIEGMAEESKIDKTYVARFLNGHVFFNHFIRLEETVSMPLLFQAWNRCAALTCKPCTQAFDHVIPVMLAPESEDLPEFGPLHGGWNDSQIEEARKHLGIILLNSRNYSKPTNQDKAALKMTVNDKNILFALSGNEDKPGLELNILQDFGPKQPEREPYNVNMLLNPDDSIPAKRIHFILKELSALTYPFLESLCLTTDGKMALLYLEKLRRAQSDFDYDLVTQNKVEHLYARHESVPLVFGTTHESSMIKWKNFKERGA